MKTNKLIYTLLIGLLIGFTACDDDDSIFSGSENYLTLFTLTQDDQTYTAVISSDSIIVTIPESTTLDHATATYLCSENATISPDPSTIDNWEGNQTFTVTSYNGSRRNYYYTLQRYAVSIEGVTLLNDADVEALAAQGASRIEGNLIIGATSGSDTITTLAPLEGLLTEVTGTIYIYPTFAGSSFDGLQSLQRIGGMEIYHSSTTTCYYPNLKSQSLPALTTVQNNLNLLIDTASVVSMPLLETVGGDLQIKGSSIAQIDLPQLSVVGGDFTIHNIRSSSLSLAGLEALSLPQLTMIGGDLTIGGATELTTCELPQLASVSNLTVEYNNIEELSLPNLTQVVNNIDMRSLNSIQTISMPLLTSINGLNIYGASSLTTLDLSRLETVGGTGCSLTSLSSLTNLDGFSALKTVQGEFYLNSLRSLSDLSGLDGLTYIGGQLYLTTLSSEITDFDALNNLTYVGSSLSIRSLTGITTISGLRQLSYVGGNITIYDCSVLTAVNFIPQLAGQSLNTVNVQSLPELQELDITGANISTLQIQTCGDITLTGDAILDNTTVYINYGRSVRFNGIKQVSAINVNSLNTTTDESYVYDFSGVEIVTGNVTVNQTYYANSGTVCFADLRSIGGTLSITDGTYNMVKASQFPSLEEVGDITFYGVVDSFSLPKLVSVSNALTICTKYLNRGELTTINLPCLTSVGQLIIQVSGSYSNSSITDLDCFSNLQTAGSISISNQSALASYTGLRTAIASLADESCWSVSNNGYNPTWEDIQAGRLETGE